MMTPKRFGGRRRITRLPLFFVEFMRIIYLLFRDIVLICEQGGPNGSNQKDQ